MAIVDYASLQASIIDWSLKTGDINFTNNVTSFISMAEEQINLDLRVRWNTNNVILTTNVIDGSLTLPTDYLDFDAVVAQTNPISPLTYVTVQSYYGLLQTNPNPGSGIPTKFTIIDGQMFFYPSVGTTPISVQLVYYQAVPSLSILNTTNFVIANAPRLYLYGSLIYASQYNQDDDSEQRWATSYATTLESIIKSNVRSEYATGMMIITPDVVY